MHVLKVPRDEAIAKARGLLERVGLSDKEDTHPLFLSGGQQQRAAIARALAVDPEVMLFDEPTSALDPELVGEVLGVIRDLAAEGRTMLLVTHEMSFAREVASKVVYLYQGRSKNRATPMMSLGIRNQSGLSNFYKPSPEPHKSNKERVNMKHLKSAALGLTFFCLAGAASAETVKIGVAAEPYPPFASPTSSGEWEGWEIEVIHAVCEAAKLDCEITPIAWDGIIPSLNGKQIDASWHQCRSLKSA